MVGSNPVLKYIYDEAQGAGLGNTKFKFYYLLFITSGFLLIKKLDSCKCNMFLNYFRDTYDITVFYDYLLDWIYWAAKVGYFLYNSRGFFIKNIIN